MSIYARVAPTFPARILGENGIDVDTTGGIATVSFDPGQFPVSADPIGESQTVLVYDPVSGDTERAEASSLFGLNVPIFASKAQAASATISASIKSLRTQFHDPDYDDPATLVGGANYARISKVDLDVLTGAGLTSEAWFRSQDRAMPDGEVHTTNGGYWVLNEGHATPYMLGAHGDYDTDDTDAIKAWVAYAAATQKPIHLAKGVYRCTDSIELPERVIITGDGAPVIATFPQTGGDKSLLRPGYKHLISGASLIFSGTPTKEITTTRSDKFASFYPCVVYDHLAPPNLSNFAIIQDMDVLDAGGTLTTVANDNRATAYTAGFWTKSTLGGFERLTVFGIFSVQGVVQGNVSDDTSHDPDYNRHLACTYSGGVAIIGSDSGDVTEGHTGSTFIGCGIYGADHHTRAESDPNIPCLYIDGDIQSSIGHIRSHSFNGCHFRTIVNNAIVLDHCDDVTFSGGTTEFSLVSGVAGLDALGKIVGTANTQDVRILGLGSTHDMGIADLIATVDGTVICAGSGGASDRVYVASGGAGIALRGDASTGDSVVQITDDFSTSTAQWTVVRDDDQSDQLQFRWNNVTVASLSNTGALNARLTGIQYGSGLTIDAGAVTITHSGHSVDTEAAASTDDLTTVNGATFIGQRLTLRAATTSRDVVVKDSGGNLRLAGGDFTLDHSQDRIELEWDGSNWCEISRSDNTT